MGELELTTLNFSGDERTVVFRKRVSTDTGGLLECASTEELCELMCEHRALLLSVYVSHSTNPSKDSFRLYAAPLCIYFLFLLLLLRRRMNRRLFRCLSFHSFPPFHVLFSLDPSSLKSPPPLGCVGRLKLCCHPRAETTAKASMKLHWESSSP